MRKFHSSAFTLIEMMTVIAVIVILTGLVLSLAGYANRKGALARAEGEIHMLGAACESYKAENGNYPRDVPDGGGGVTDMLSPKQHFSPVLPLYTNASLFLYKQLSGDKTGGGSDLPDGIPDENEPRYFKELDKRILNTKKNPTTKAIIQVNYLQDPFGFSYGYSTVAARNEEDFQRRLKLASGNVTPERIRNDVAGGFNAGSFDLWSTGGDNTPGNPGGEDKMGLKWAKWVKNW